MRSQPVTRERFDAVLFDLDGVLTSTAAVHADCWKQMFDEYLRRRSPAGANDPQLRPFDIDSDYKKYVDGKPRYDGVRSFLESRGIHLPWGEASEPPNDATICGLGNRKDAMVKEAIEQGRVESYEGSVRWVRQLREQGFKTAVVSSSRNCARVLRAAKIDHLFDARVDGETLLELGLPGKPAPDSFLRAAAMLGVDPGRTVVVEDAISGVQAARAGEFGLIIGVDREGHADALRQAGANLIVHDLADLTTHN
ncbi:MAG TPA: beta-phosphoglucomutase family hydrolase [Tepidisphaeraceae bacterium]|jgi:beta-phosphoglucomutase family hydrolase